MRLCICDDIAITEYFAENKDGCAGQKYQLMNWNKNTDAKDMGRTAQNCASYEELAALIWTV